MEYLLRTRNLTFNAKSILQNRRRESNGHTPGSAPTLPREALRRGLSASAAQMVPRGLSRRESQAQRGASPQHRGLTGPPQGTSPN